jgi:hypothetical protein
VTPVAAAPVSRLERRGLSGLGGPLGTFLGTGWAIESGNWRRRAVGSMNL